MSEDLHIGHRVRTIKFLFTKATEKAQEVKAKIKDYIEVINQDQKEVNELKKLKLEMVNNTADYVMYKVKEHLDKQKDRMSNTFEYMDEKIVNLNTLKRVKDLEANLSKILSIIKNTSFSIFSYQ